MKFILAYELSNREFDNLVLLKRELIKRGHTVEIHNKFGFVKLKHEEFILVVPNAYHNRHIDFYRYIYNTRDNAIVVYPCEQVINRQMPDFFDYSDKNFIKFLPTLCWGKDYYDFLQELGYKNKYTSVVGAIHLDFCRDRFIKLYDSKFSIAIKYNLPMDKKWILFISDFVYCNPQMKKRIIREGSFPESTVISMYNYEEKLQQDILKWFDLFLKENDEYIVIYRKHPVEIKNEILYTFEKEHKNQFYEISEMNIKQWIVVADKICTYNSTAIVECAVAKKPCILLRPEEFPKEAMIKEYPFYIDYPRIKNVDEFKKIIAEDSYEFVWDETMNYLYDIKEKFSYERVADVLEKIAKDNWKLHVDLKNYKIKRIEYLIKRNIFVKVCLKWIYRKVTKIFRYKKGKERIFAIKEWITVEDNIQHEILFGNKIDKVIS